MGGIVLSFDLDNRLIRPTTGSEVVIMRYTLILAVVGMSITGCGSNTATSSLPTNPRLSPNAPKDQPVEARGDQEAAEYNAAIAPYVEKGRKSYPGAKSRFLAGLPAGQHFFVVTRLRDGTGSSEGVFVAVASIQSGRITGRIASNILGVKGFKEGDPYVFSETDLEDWLITHPDGSEEGNVVGKFLDEWQKTRPRK